MTALAVTATIMTMTVAKGGEAAVEQLEKELGLQVRRLRKSQGLTQQKLADRANTSVGAIKNLESGQGATTRTLARALRALGAEDWIETLYVPRSTFNPLDLPSPSAPSRADRPATKTG
jgi:transcriptional regulator with XRE-family HTH domain